ncbi:hypothetical protein BOTBODRAFT_26708 [Botryobasidium botryosum FD-172 SS1]|uniref:Protein kinase domain-containing protein n=1 Tax=Botryobasidium botryosum (strain FD-172 SS1) TaxID=930990 RepID=A0A067N160_BOTB1|nr:hypothetical protein BOTBODRAFT_26708 [Botryobasidium botryosum FD-172 SS1]
MTAAAVTNEKQSAPPSPTVAFSVFSSLASKSMMKLWPTGPMDQTTPKPTVQGEDRSNPFDAPRIVHTVTIPPATGPASGVRTPTTSTAPSHHHHLLNTHNHTTPHTPIGEASVGVTPALGVPTTSAPTTQISLTTPEFKIQRPPFRRNRTSSNPTSNGVTSSKGQIHVKLIQARGLSVVSPDARPYVVVQFEQNEFVSREPIAETEKEVKGRPVTLSRNSSSTALSALGLGASGIARAFDAAVRSRASTTSNSSAESGSPNGSGMRTPGLFGSVSAHNPTWKHEVSFDVTSEDSLINFAIYDRAQESELFLGVVELQPVLIHDHTVDQWIKVKPRENEPVTGELRVQVTYEQYKTKRALTPRDFEFMKLIGRGTFGRVFQVRKKDTRRIYAMKVLSKKEIVEKKEVAHTIGERKILQRSLECPFLVGLKFSFQTDTELYLVTDFKSGGELFWHLQKETKFSEERARFYIAELVLALEHLHKYDIVYRDLKPENILLDATGHVALCDFGLSKADLGADQLTNTFCGTTEYLAPEVLLDDHGYSKLVDFWSLGVLLFEMCCGWSPFYAEDTEQMYKNICFGKIRFPRGVIGEDGKQFVKGLLNRNPKNRLGAQRDAEELKEHSFFKTIDWRALSLKQVTPPFKPVVESDESTANFDPEFTTSDLRDAGVDIFDDDDPSDAWVASVGTGNGNVHQFHGPGGITTDGASRPPAVAITKKKAKFAVDQGSPLTNSIQENFRGFTYQGGESVINQAGGHLGDRDDEDEDEEVQDEDVRTEDEWEDDTPAGRYLKRGELDMH